MQRNNKLYFIAFLYIFFNASFVISPFLTAYFGLSTDETDSIVQTLGEVVTINVYPESATPTRQLKPIFVIRTLSSIFCISTH